MSISIDGKVHTGKLRIRYGEEFPKRYQSLEINHDNYGHCLIYITALGRPEWTEKMMVAVPYKYYITQIIEPNKKYLADRKRKESKLKLVKG